MNPFQQMASVLTRHAVEESMESVPAATRKSAADRYNGNTAKVRAVIQAGPATAKEIAQACGLQDSGKVMALIRHDVEKGLIVYRDRIYRRGAA